MMLDINAVKMAAKIISSAFLLSLIIFPGTVCAESATDLGIFDYISASYEEKLAGMYSEAMDYKSPAVSSFAFLRVSPKNSGNYTVYQACDLWDYLNDEWRIVSDPRGPEYISSSLGTIRAGLRGDCDDYSVFLSSVIMSLGGKCRIVSAFNTGDKTGHTYPEVFIGYGDSEALEVCKSVATRYDCKKIYYSITDESGIKAYWMNLDWVIPRYYGPRYYTYGSTKADIEAYHPGRVYYQADSVTQYYADGEWDSSTPAYGYYQRTTSGTDTLNEI